MRGQGDGQRPVFGARIGVGESSRDPDEFAQSRQIVAQHYAEAERLLDMAESELERYANAESGSHAETVHLQQSQWATSRAQVEATLALTAATVDAARGSSWVNGPISVPQA